MMPTEFHKASPSREMIVFATVQHYSNICSS